MSKNEQVKSLTRGELVRKLANDVIDFGDDGVIIDLARELGYNAKKINHHDWTLNHGEWHE